MPLLDGLNSFQACFHCKTIAPSSTIRFSSKEIRVDGIEALKAPVVQSDHRFTCVLVWLVEFDWDWLGRGRFGSMDPYERRGERCVEHAECLLGIRRGKQGRVDSRV